LGSPVRLYNTLTRSVDELRPLEPGRVQIYTCGPTVYRYVHIGNLRTFIFADVLCRVMEYAGLQVRQVKNITDVGHLTDETFDRGEDKMLLSARLEQKSPQEIADFYTQAFHADQALVNIRPAAVYPRASQHIAEMIQLVERLLELGHAYVVDGTVYYAVDSFTTYGKLSRNTTGQLLAGHRSAVDPQKRNPADFTLWKAAGPGRLMAWDSPWGRGFPGWHIECSAMSLKHLGERFDIHTGGADNVFPHHEAEIAQSEGVLGHQVVGCWMHGQHLMLSGARMAKSAGNFMRISELAELGYDPLAFRYLTFQARYRHKLNFSLEALASADRALRQLRDRVAEWSGGPVGPPSDHAERFRAAVSDDLDLPRAMAIVADLGRAQVPAGTKAGLLLDFDRVLGLDLDRELSGRELPEGTAELLSAREAARAAKDWTTSDRLRDQLAAIGVMVTDTAEGQRWKVVDRAPAAPL
jgi:cysteinyl-tRNA synthetase